MRIATSTLFNVGSSALQKHQADQVRLQEQMSSGRRMLTPADDPIASARALNVSQTSSITKQYSTNSDTADSALGISESTITQIVRVIQDVQALVVSAGVSHQTAADKKIIDTELQGKYSELLGLANSKDGSGIYLFSGFQGNTQPFSETSFGNVVYNGDEGQRKIQISSGRQIPISESGSDMLQRIKNGNGTFVTAASAGNTGSGIVSKGQVLDPNKWAAAPAPQDFKVQFYWQTNTANPSKPIISYDLVNSAGFSLIDGVDTGTTPRTSGTRPYTDGANIEFKQLAGETTPLASGWDYGVIMNVTGTPVAIDATTGVPTGVAGQADSFTVKASTNVDLFATLGQMSAALNSYTTDGSGKGQADFMNAMSGVMLNLDNALNNVLTTQSSIGARMNETQSVKDTNSDLQLQYQKTLSTLQDLDYTAAISDFSMNQMVLEATRSSFAKVQELSLFKYI